MKTPLICFAMNPLIKERKDKYTLIEKIILDSVIIIHNYLEENLRNKLKNTGNYERNHVEIDARFNRRFALYKQQNEVMAENKKFLKDFYKEYNIEVYFLDEQKYMLNKDEEEKKVIEFLERNGPIDNYSNLHDVDDVIPYIDTLLGENIYMPNEEQILFDQNGPYNFGNKKKVDIIKEENENNLNTNNNINNENNTNNNLNEVNNANNNLSKQENNNESKALIKNEKSQLNNVSKTILSKKEENNNDNNETIKEEAEQNKEEIKEQNEIKEEEKANVEQNKEVKEVLTEEQKIELQLKDLKEREKKLLEKKSEVLRRYLSENVMPLLAKGILTACESMPDDPVDALANFLLENSFNMQKAKIGEIEKIMDNE